MELAALLAVAFALGLVFGYEWGNRRPVKDTSPVPDYDPENPINGKGHRGEIVEICGHPMTRMN